MTIELGVIFTLTRRRGASRTRIYEVEFTEDGEHPSPALTSGRTAFVQSPPGTFRFVNTHTVSSRVSYPVTVTGFRVLELSGWSPFDSGPVVLRAEGDIVEMPPGSLRFAPLAP